MNYSLPNESVLEARFAAELDRLLRGVSWLRGWRVEHPGPARDPGFDLRATIPIPGGGKSALLIECKREFRPSAFHALKVRAEEWKSRHTESVRVLALPWVSPRVAELCNEAGWSWFDLAGNHLIDIPGVLRLERSGNVPVHSTPRRSANLATREAARVIRALLNPNALQLRWTQRSIQEACSPTVSIGLVNKVVRHLVDEAFVAKDPARGIRVIDPLRLLRTWGESNQVDRAQRIGLFSLLKSDSLAHALDQVGAKTNGHAAYASFSAAERQAPHVRQPRIWIYIGAHDIGALEQEAQAKRVESGENIVALVPDDAGVFQGLEAEAAGMPSTNPVQTWVDLFKSGGRGEEAADALLEQRLLPAWRDLGLTA